MNFELDLLALPDPRSTVFMQAAISILMAIMLFTMGKAESQKAKDANCWGFALLCLSCASTLYGLRGEIPLLLSLNLANFLHLAAHILICVGSYYFFGQAAHIKFFIALVVIVNVVLNYLSLMFTNTFILVAMFSVIVAPMLWFFGRIVLANMPQNMRRFKLPYFFTAYAAIAGSIMVLVRLIYVLSDPLFSNDVFSRNPFNALFFYAFNLVLICISVGLILMLNERLHARLDHQVRHDFLTGVYSRSALMELIAEELSISAPQNTSLLLLDLDHFKKVNDKLGHLTGDKVLCHVTQVLASELRTIDNLARYGGEEFFALLRCTNNEQAALIGERLRLAVADNPFWHNGELVKITISIGCATACAGEGLESFLNRTDKALYAAKNQGRNCVVQA